MLKIIDKPTFVALVTVATAVLQGTFKATFVALPTSELKAAEQRAAERGEGPQGMLTDVVKGFEDIELNGQTLAYEGPASLQTLLDQPGIGPAMVKAYYRSLWEEATKN